MTWREINWKHKISSSHLTSSRLWLNCHKINGHFVNVLSFRRLSSAVMRTDAFRWRGDFRLPCLLQQQQQCSASVSIVTAAAAGSADFSTNCWWVFTITHWFCRLKLYRSAHNGPTCLSCQVYTVFHLHSVRWRNIWSSIKITVSCCVTLLLQVHESVCLYLDFSLCSDANQQFM